MRWDSWWDRGRGLAAGRAERRRRAVAVERLEGRRLLSGQGNLEAVLPAESQGTDTTVAAGQYQSGFEYWVLVKRPEQRVLA